MKFKLTTNDILNKKFTCSEKGYDPFEVDAFLDIVLEDYRTLEYETKNVEKKIEKLTGEIVILKKKVEDLKQNQELENLSFIKKDNIDDYQVLDNLDLLKRCSKYEKKLYSLGIDPSKIK